jgi:serine/threonine protein phosphatase PrpC
MRFSYKTKKGYSSSNPYKINQDNYITCPNINSKTWEHIFGICDGHGPLGHLVSSFIKTNLPKSISQIKML